jgi:hypothetical protein
LVIKSLPPLLYFVILTFLAFFSRSSYSSEVLYNNTSTISLTGTSSVTTTQFVASKIDSGSQAKIITSFLVSMNLRTAGAGLAGQVCPDNGSGTAPGTPCIEFTPSTLPIGSFSYIAFTGSYNLSANSTYWLVVKTSGPGTYRMEDGSLSPSVGYISTNSGATWSPSDSFPLQVLGSSASAPTATTNAATSASTTGATINGTVNDNGATTTVTFNYGTTASYGTSVSATPATVSAGAGSTSVSASLTGLTCNTIYHYRVSAENSVGTTNGSDATFTTSACPTPTLSISNSPQTYTGTGIAALVSCLGGGTVSNVQYSGNSTVPTSAGSYAVTADCTASSNYAAVTGASAGNFVISPATPTLSISNSPQTYTGSGIPATVSCLGGGTVSNLLYGGSATLPIAAGTYAVTANCAASTNYSAVTGASAGSFVISAATPTLSVTNSPQSYTGSAIPATVSCQGGGVASNILYGGSSSAPSDVGTYAITANCAASTNYSAVTGASAGSFVISRAAPTLSVSNTPQTYTGTGIAAVVSCLGGGTASNVLYDGSATLPITAGTYAMTADCAASTNYSAVTGASAGSFVISAATPTLSVTNSPQSYTGSAIPATVSCQGGGVASNILYGGSSSAPSDVGTYAITANCAASTNYSAVTGASAGSFVISAATPTLSVTNSPQSYTGSAIPAVVSCSSDGAVSNIKYNGNSSVPINAGAYAVTANCAATGSYSYLTGASAGTFVISAASQSINLVATPNAITVSGTSALSITGASGTGAVSYSLVSGPCRLAQNPAVLTGTGAGSCVVTATIAADPNHGSASSNPVTVTVAGPPIVTHVTAIPGAGFIKVVFDVVNSTSSASVVRVQTAVMYTATCTSTDGGVTVSATGPGSPLNVTGTNAGKSYTCSVTGTDGSGSSTSEPSNAVTPAPAPPPVNPIPTLSAWAQILMMLMMIGAAGWQTRRVIRRR